MEPKAQEATRTQVAVGGLLMLTTAIVAVAALAAGLVFGAYGCGKLFSRWLSFSPFEATVVSLLALVTAGVVVAMVAIRFFAHLERHSHPERCENCGAGYDDAMDDEEPAEGDDEVELGKALDGLRSALFAAGVIKPNSPCPCGSGRRYNKCCGSGRAFREGH
jgi:hypothetical protein